jgi:hypothetical protein
MMAMLRAGVDQLVTERLPVPAAATFTAAGPSTPAGTPVTRRTRGKRAKAFIAAPVVNAVPMPVAAPFATQQPTPVPIAAPLATPDQPVVFWFCCYLFFYNPFDNCFSSTICAKFVQNNQKAMQHKQSLL